ncbi:MAG: hypothetical protein KKG88_07595 [Proteobacteria bacterium]|jgi:hypothetical protein|nr:hypothetical protein [Pseudomonadota bacterium]
MFDFGTMIDGNNALAVRVEVPTETQPAPLHAIPTRHKPARVSPADLLAFGEGFVWIRPRLPDLIRAGWTRAELFRRNRARRGVAWLGLWADKAATADLTTNGSIRFTFTRGDRTCTQTARPLSWHRL